MIGLILLSNVNVEVLAELVRKVTNWMNFVESIEFKAIPEEFKSEIVETQTHLEKIQNHIEQVANRDRYFDHQELDIAITHSKYIDSLIENIADKGEEQFFSEFIKAVSFMESQLYYVVETSGYYTTRAINDFQEKFQDKLNEFEETAHAKRREQEDQFNSFINQLNTQSEEHLSSSKERKKQIEDILGHVSENIFEAKYEEAADDDKKQRNNWQIGALIGIGGMILFTLISFYFFQDPDNFSIYSLTEKIVSVGTLGALATYSAIQARSYDKKFTKNKLMALRLATLDTFLAGIEENKKNEIKEKLVFEMFADNVKHLPEENTLLLSNQDLIKIKELLNFEENYTKKQRYPKKHP